MKTAIVSELIDVATGLGEDECNVLLAIAYRLQKGQQEYGEFHLVHDSRDWTREAGAEFLDASVYLAIKMLKEQQ